MTTHEAALKIASRLISKYEKSAAFRKGSTQRILITARTDHDLFDMLEDPDQYDSFIGACRYLMENRIAGYEIDRDNPELPERIFLPADEEMIRNAYAFIGRRNKGDVLSDLTSSIQECADSMPQSPIKDYLLKTLAYISEKKKLPSPFTGTETDSDILKVLIFISDNEDEITERVLSIRLFGDSKHFERAVKAGILSILRKIHPDQNDDSLLPWYSVVRYPEEFLFSGEISFTFIDGGSIDYSSLKGVAAITSTDAARIESVSSETLQSITTVENKANFFELASSRKNDELVVYLGGFFSPAKGRFLRKLRDSFPEASFRHTGDIDAGGFSIFVKLKNEIIPEIQPYMMDSETLLRHIDSAERISNPEYLHRLEALRDDPDYEIFSGVLSIMLDKKVRLEQEALI